nr:11895_t:CDS:2 [Entrophospora candida]CAG8437909.1 12134_t:CDS:2 [Entrophospora candida]
MSDPSLSSELFQYSVEVPSDKEVIGEGLPRRNYLSPDKLTDNPPGATTLYENFLHGIKASEGGNFLGHREINNGVAGPYVWQTYTEVEKRVSNFGSGLMKLGVNVKETIGFLSINRPEYIIGELACYQYGLIPVPLYDTLGDEAIKYIINQTDMEYVLTTSNKAKSLISLHESVPKLKHIIIMDDLVDDDLNDLRQLNSNIQIKKLISIEADGAINPVEAIPPKPDDISTISYTSGTTGLPKGVVLTHKNVLATGGSIEFLNSKGKMFGSSKDNVYISYLPLAHVLEKVSVTSMIYAGSAIGFYQGDTLKLLDDISELKPTIFVSVPRLLNRVYDKVMAGVKSKGGITQFLFNTAFNVKKKNLSKGTVEHILWDKLVFRPIRARLGGRVKSILSGSAPISPDVMDFLRICFSADVYEGYGQTENAAGITISLLGDTNSGHVGAPQTSVEVKLVDVPDMKYFSNDKPLPRGEICVRGNTVFREYYKSPEKTAETLDENGWCHTGDVGMWDKQGRLVVIDRVKNIFKLAQGEYIAPEKIENTYQKHELVSQAFVHGDSLQASLVGIIIPDQENLTAWAKDNGFGDKSFEELCKEPKVKEHIKTALQKFGKANDLKGFENIKNIYLTSEPFSVENGMFTPTFKLKRHQAKLHFKKQIDEMYAEIQ